VPPAPAPDLRNDHGHGAGVERHERRTRWVVGVTAAMMVVELVIGYTTGSMALVADGWHMATHAGAIGVSAGAYWFARTRAGHPAFTFGTGKVYALAGYTSAVALALVAVWIGLESAVRLARPVEIAFADALPVAVLGLVVNVACAYLLSDDDHDHDHGDHNLRSAHLHVVADAFTSVLAIAALLGGRHLGWTFLDPAMGLVGAVVILRWAWVLCRGAARQLLDVTPSSALEGTVRAQLEAVDDVRVLDLHVWALGPGRTGCIASIATSTPRDTAHYRDAVRRVVDLAHVTIEVHRAPVEADVGA
jgi:cation diffusion facilitator family transporter